MVDSFDIAIALFAVPGGLWFGYQAITTIKLYRVLSKAEVDATVGLSDGESTTVEGEVKVEEPATAADRATSSTDIPVAMYLWRARFPKAGSYSFNFVDKKLKQSMATFASGIEWGLFTVSDAGRTVRVDPEWLVDTHDSPALDTFTVGGIVKNDTFSTYLWDSPYVNLSSKSYEMPLKRLVGVINKCKPNVDIDENSFESRSVLEGTTLTVHGKIDIKKGEPVIRGTNETPLLISDQGFDSHSRKLRNQSIKYGFLSMILLILIVLLFI